MITRFLTKSELAQHIPSASARKDRKTILRNGKNELSKGIALSTLKKESIHFLKSCDEKYLQQFAKQWDAKKTIPPRICNLIIEHLIGVETN